MGRCKVSVCGISWDESEVTMGVEFAIWLAGRDWGHSSLGQGLWSCRVWMLRPPRFTGEYEFFSVSSPNTSNMASNFPNYPCPSCPVFVRLTLLQSVAVEASRFACCCCCWWPRSSRFPFFLVPDMWFTFISEVSVCSERSKSISLRSMGPFWSCVGWYSVDGLGCSISWEAVTTLIVQF